MSLKDKISEVKSSIDNLIVSNEIFGKRLSICKSCPELNQSIVQCNKCGCFVLMKARLGNAVCPLGKW